jgi:hypothetical protein
MAIQFNGVKATRRENSTERALSRVAEGEAPQLCSCSAMTFIDVSHVYY